MTDKDDERRQALAAMRQSEARFAGILAIAADAIISIDENQRITLFNEGAEQTFGYRRAEVLGLNLDVLIPERFRRNHASHIATFAASATAARRMGDRQEIYALHKSGREFPAEASISRLDIDGERTYTVVLRDVTERKTAEVALRESEQRLWAFLNNNSVVGWMKDEEGRYVFLSGTLQRRFASRLGHWMGKTDFEIWPREIAQSSASSDRRVLAENCSVEVLDRLPESDGRLTWWLTHKFPFHDSQGNRYVGGLGVDITERVEAETALARSHAELEARVEERTRELRAEMRRHQEAQSAVSRLQRMEALGQLTGGVAHDFNNLLTVISGNLQLIGMDLEDPKLRGYLEEAERAAEMGARLNQRLMTFAKQRRLAPTAVNLNDQVISVRELLRRTLGETISLSTELAEDLWTVEVDPSEIENALLNLVINARDAMPSGGQLTLATSNAVVAPGDGITDSGLVPGDYVILTVSDTGTGMTPDVLARVFEPFFTTKGQGKGTGLGLATIYGFVKQSGGHVGIESAPGKGTTVRIYLPRVRAALSADPHRYERAIEEDGRDRTILVVEDHDAVRRVTVERLAALGYRTLEAESGPGALEVLEKCANDVDLVFSDVVMPGGMSGYDLSRAVAERWPQLKVLLTSGYAPETAARATGTAAGVDILMKPYAQSALARAIARALAGSAPQSRTTGAENT